MGRRTRESGFTITEVSLFLAITAFLVVTLMGGWTTAVNTQSYRDSARSLALALQHEFTSVTNVRNERSNDQACSASGNSIGAALRGTTDCIVMGRYIDFDGSQILSTYITGLEDSNIDDPPGADNGAASDKDVILSYTPVKINTTLAPTLLTTEEIRWSSSPYNPGDMGTPLRFAMVIVRSPATGATYTYWRTYTDTAPPVTEIIDAPNAPANTAQRVICLDPQGITLGESLAVVISARASSSSAVRVLSQNGGSGC